MLGIVPNEGMSPEKHPHDRIPVAKVGDSGIIHAFGAIDGSKC